MKETWKQDLGAGLAIIGLYAVLFALGITCPIKFVTGVSCPGCGMTRACLSLLGGDPAAAFGYHPLVWLLPAALALYLFRARLPRRALRYAPAVLAGLFCVVYLIRMLSGCAPDVVTFSPEKGLLYRLGATVLARI